MTLFRELFNGDTHAPAQGTRVGAWVAEVASVVVLEKHHLHSAWCLDSSPPVIPRIRDPDPLGLLSSIDPPGVRAATSDSGATTGTTAATSTTSAALAPAPTPPTASDVPASSTGINGRDRPSKRHKPSRPPNETTIAATSATSASTVGAAAAEGVVQNASIFSSPVAKGVDDLQPGPVASTELNDVRDTKANGAREAEVRAEELGSGSGSGSALGAKRISVAGAGGATRVDGEVWGGGTLKRTLSEGATQVHRN